MGGGVGGMLYSIADGTRTYSHSNHRGDVIARSDSNGSLTSFALYEAYGTRPYEWSDGVTGDPDRQKANTKEEESDLGLLNEGMRFRDLETGVFLTRDPIGYGDGPNVYCYVHCNPITHFDALGLNDDTIISAAGKAGNANRNYLNKRNKADALRADATTKRTAVNDMWSDWVKNPTKYTGYDIDKAENAARRAEAAATGAESLASSAYEANVQAATEYGHVLLDEGYEFDMNDQYNTGQWLLAGALPPGESFTRSPRPGMESFMNVHHNGKHNGVDMGWSFGLESTAGVGGSTSGAGTGPTTGLNVSGSFMRSVFTPSSSTFTETMNVSIWKGGFSITRDKYTWEIIGYSYGAVAGPKQLPVGVSFSEGRDNGKPRHQWLTPSERPKPKTTSLNLGM